MGEVGFGGVSFGRAEVACGNSVKFEFIASIVSIWVERRAPSDRPARLGSLVQRIIMLLEDREPEVVELKGDWEWRWRDPREGEWWQVRLEQA